MAVVTAVVIAAAGLALSAYGQYKSHKAQKKQAKAEKKERNLRFRKERREQIRRAQIAQSQIENAGAQIGGSVGNVAGGARSVQSQAGANIGFLTGVNAFQNQQAKYAGQAQKFGMVSQIGSQLFSIGTGMMGGGGQATPKVPPSAATYGARGTAGGAYGSTPVGDYGAFI